MKCEHCGSEWTTSKSVTNLTKCPFCDKTLIIEKQNEIGMTIAAVLKQMITTYGEDVISEQKKCISIFRDIAPQLKDEQKILKIALDSGIANYFISCPINERESNIKKALYAIDYLNDKAKELIIDSFVEAFDWDKELLVKGSTYRNSYWNYTEKREVQNKLDLLEPDTESAENNYKLGRKYYFGNGVLQNYSKAAEYFQKAVLQGSVKAQNDLGVMYEEGKGVKQDYSKAVELYLKAAQQDYAYAQNNLGALFEKGKGVKQDYGKAFEWYRKAALQKHADAQYNLGMMYKNGKGVTKDSDEAIKWLRKAAAKDHREAQSVLSTYRI